MIDKKVLDEYRELANKAKKIEDERTKTFFVHGMGVCVGSIAIQLLSNSDTISALYIGSSLFFSAKNFLNPDLFYYPLINHSLYKNALEEYKVVIQRTADAMKESKELDPAYLAGIYQMLLERGDFSYNRNTTNLKNQNPYFLLPDKDKGMFLINGYQTNTYVPFHFKELLNQAGIINATLPVLFKNNVFKCSITDDEYEEEIIIPKEIDNLDSTLFPSVLGNYQLNILKVDNKEQVYYIDILNEIFFNKKTSKSLQLPNTPILKIEGFSKKDYILPIKSLGDKLYSSKENTKLAKQLLTYNDIANIEAMSNYTRGQKYVIDNSDFFEKLYTANQVNYKEIATNLTTLENIAKQYENEQKSKTNKS